MFKIFHLGGRKYRSLPRGGQRADQRRASGRSADSLPSRQPAQQFSARFPGKLRQQRLIVQKACDSRLHDPASGRGGGMLLVRGGGIRCGSGIQYRSAAIRCVPGVRGQNRGSHILARMPYHAGEAADFGGSSRRISWTVPTKHWRYSLDMRFSSSSSWSLRSPSPAPAPGPASRPPGCPRAWSI